MTFRLPLSKVFIKGIEQEAQIEWVKIDVGSTIFYQVSYWLDGKSQGCMLHEDEVTDLPGS